MGHSLAPDDVGLLRDLSLKTIGVEKGWYVNRWSRSSSTLLVQALEDNSELLWTLSTRQVIKKT